MSGHTPQQRIRSGMRIETRSTIQDAISNPLTCGIRSRKGGCTVFSESSFGRCVMTFKWFVLSLALLVAGVFISGCYTTFAAAETGHASTYRTAHTDRYADDYEEAVEDTAYGQPGLMLNERHDTDESCDPGVVVHLHFGPTWSGYYARDPYWAFYWDDPWYYDPWWDPWPYYTSYWYYRPYVVYPGWRHWPYYAWYSPYYSPYYGHPVYYPVRDLDRRDFARRSAIPAASRRRDDPGRDNSNERRAIATRSTQPSGQPGRSNERGSDRRRPVTVRDVRPDPPSARRPEDRRTDTGSQRSGSTPQSGRRTTERRIERPSGSSTRVGTSERRSTENQQKPSVSRSITQRIRDAARSVSRSVQTSRPSSSGSSSRSASKPAVSRSSSSSRSSAPSASPRSSRPSTPSRSSGSSSSRSGSRSGSSSSGGRRR